MSFFRVSSESSENILPLPWILVGVGVLILGLLIVGCAVHRIRRKIKSKALLCRSTNLNKKDLIKKNTLMHYAAQILKGEKQRFSTVVVPHSIYLYL